MKKPNLKIIFSSVGAITAISTIAGGVVSCGTSTSPTNDFPQTAIQAFTIKKLNPITLSAVVNKLNVKNNDIKSFTFSIDKTTKRIKNIANTIISGSFTYNNIKYKFNQSVNYDFNIKSYIVINNTLIMNYQNLIINGDTYNPTTDTFTMKSLTPIVKSALVTKINQSNTDIKELSFKIGTIIVDDKSNPKPKTIVNGTFKDNSTKFTFKENISYDGSNYIVNKTMLKINKQKSPVAFMPFDDSYITHKDGTRVYNNKALYDTLIKPFLDMQGDYLFDFQLVSHVTWNEEAHIAVATFTGHGNKHSYWSKTPFRAEVTCNYVTKKYTITTFKYWQNYVEALDNKKIQAPITNRLYKELNCPTNAITNIKFSENDINDSVDNVPSVDVAGVYTYKAPNSKTTIVKRFNMRVTYRYSNQEYTTTNFKDGINISQFFLTDKDSGLYNEVLGSIKTKGYSNFSNLMQQGKIVFENKNYYKNTIEATFTGQVTGNSQDASPANFTTTISYNLTTKKYNCENLIITSMFPGKLTQKALYAPVASSLKNFSAGLFNEYLILNFSLNSITVNPKDPNKVTVHINARTCEIAKSNPHYDTRYIKSFSVDVTYDNSKTKSWEQYTTSNFKTDNKIEVDIYSQKNMTTAMTNIISSDPKNKNGKITDVICTQKQNKTVLSREINGISSQVSIEYKLNGIKKTTSGSLIYNFDTAKYTWTLKAL